MSLTLSNGHTRATVLSAVWSEPDVQLVAAQLAAGDQQSLLALKAELEKNSKNSQVTLRGDAKADLAGARRGYLRLATALERVNAHGHTLVLRHWRAGDPRLIPQPKEGPAFFYVVVAQGEDLLMAFVERLQLAIPWPLKVEWRETLLAAGLEASLVQHLCLAQAMEPGPGTGAARGVAFTAGVRVLADAPAWGEVISSGLQNGTLTMEGQA